MKNYYRWVLLLAIALITFIINVDYTAVNLALIPMATDLHIELNTIQWVLSGYALAWAIFVIPGGSLADRYQKKYLCLIGVGLFLTASLLAGIAQTGTMMIVARILQGMAGGIYISSIYALIYINFSENERGRAMGLVSLGVGLGMAIGPFIGGVLLSWLSWRSIFLINIPVGLLVIGIIAKSDRELLKTKPSSINKLSLFLLSASIISFLYVLAEWHHWQESTFYYDGLAIFGLVTFSTFIYLQKKLEVPLIPLKLFSNLPFVGCCIGMLLEQYAFSTIIVSTGIYLQKVLYQSSLNSSLFYLALTVIFGIIAAMGGSWVDRIGLRIPTVVGLSLIVIGSLFFSYLPFETEWLMICSVLLILGIGMGLAFAALNAGVVKTLSQESIGIGSSVFLICALVGNAVAVTLTTLIYQQFSLSRMLQIFDTYKVKLDDNQLQIIQHYISYIGSGSNNLVGLNQKAQDMIHDFSSVALNYGIHKVMIVNAVVVLFAVFFCSLLLKNRSAVNLATQQELIET